MMRCTQNKFTIFFIGLSLLGRVAAGHKSTDMLWVGSGDGLGHKKLPMSNSDLYK